jgi:hypothetical protein
MFCSSAGLGPENDSAGQAQQKTRPLVLEGTPKDGKGHVSQVGAQYQERLADRPSVTKDLGLQSS